jgi:hypothetical protein
MNAPSLFEEFCVFSRAQVESWDIDPSYPLLKSLNGLLGNTIEQSLWLTSIYVTWYDVGSALRVFEKASQPCSQNDLSSRLEGVRFPTGVERRGLRAPGACESHLLDIWRSVEMLGGPEAFIRACNELSGEKGWDFARSSISKVRGSGPWATYKWADLLKHVHGATITASSIGEKAGSSSGPIPGLVLITGLPAKICGSDLILQKRLLSESVDKGSGLSGLDQFETCLCDFNSYFKGRYYTGHDIDSQQASISPFDERIRAARGVFPEAFRGELGGWSGVRRELLGTPVHREYIKGRFDNR